MCWKKDLDYHGLVSLSVTSRRWVSIPHDFLDRPNAEAAVYILIQSHLLSPLTYDMFLPLTQIDTKRQTFSVIYILETGVPSVVRMFICRT